MRRYWYQVVHAHKLKFATKVVDHSFITQINQIRKEWEAKGRELEFVGMDHLVPVSSHPMASRKLNVTV